LTASSENNLEPADASACIEVTGDCDITIEFDWSYSTDLAGISNNSFIYSVGGVETTLTHGNVIQESGAEAILIPAAQLPTTFCFILRTTQAVINNFATTIINNFSVTSACCKTEGVIASQALSLEQKVAQNRSDLSLASYSIINDNYSWSDSNEDIDTFTLPTPDKFTVKELSLLDVGASHVEISSNFGNFLLNTDYPQTSLAFVKDRWIQMSGGASQIPWYPVKISPQNPLQGLDLEQDFQGALIGFSVDTNFQRDIIVAGAPNANKTVDEATHYRGATIISLFLNANWNPNVLSIGDADSEEGFSVSSSALGNVIVSGLPGYKSNLINPDYIGAVAIYDVSIANTNGLSSFNINSFLLTPPTGTFDPVNDGNFGSAVSISADGRTLVVGGTNKFPQDGVPNNTGHIWIFKRENNIWELQQLIEYSNPYPGDVSVNPYLDVSQDGKYVAYTESQFTGIGNPFVNKLRIYQRNPSGVAPNKYFEILDTDIDEGTISGFSMSQNGKVIAIGYNNDTTEFGNVRKGFVNIYEQNTYQTWIFKAKLTAGNENDFFGTSVSLSATGKTLLVGGIDELGNGLEGNVFPFTKNGEQWNMQIKISNSYPLYGASVAAMADGRGGIVGAIGIADTASSGILLLLQ